MQRLRRRVRARGQRGASLIEILIATAVLMPLTLSATLGITTAIRSSDRAEARQELNVALTNATESLRRLPYVPCATPKDYQVLYGSEVDLAASEGTRTGAQLAKPVIDAVDHWNPEKRTYVEECERDHGTQRVTLTVTRAGSASGPMSATGSIVLSEETRP